MSASAYSRYRTKAVYAKTSFGPVIAQHDLNLTDGGVRQIPFAHPLALIEWAIRNEPDFHRFFRAVCDHYSNKLGIVLYSDEITPGMALKPDNRRITNALYWSIRQFGFPHLHKDAMWWTSTTIRSDVVHLIRDGMAQVFKVFMLLLWNDNGWKGEPWHHIARRA